MKKSGRFTFVVQVVFAILVAGFFRPANAEQASGLDIQSVVIEPVLEADQFRPWIITGHYSLLDLMLPNKIGLMVERRDDARTSWAFEFSHGSFSPFLLKDLGSFTEDRFTISRRISGLDGGGFQFFYGAFYQQFKLAIGSELLNRLSGGYYPGFDAIKIGGIGAMIGVGYRWMIQGKFVVAIDGLAWSQPLATTSREARFLEVVSNQNDREDIEKGIRVMEYFPRFLVAKFSFGYAF